MTIIKSYTSPHPATPGEVEINDDKRLLLFLPEQRRRVAAGESAGGVVGVGRCGSATK